MSEFIILLLMQVTVFSSVAAVLIIAVKQIFKCRIPPVIGMFMWVVLLARLLCPIYPESHVSIYNYVPVGRDIMFSLTYDVNSGVDELEQRRFEAENPYVIKNRDVQDVSSNVNDKLTSDSGNDDMSIGTYISNAISGGSVSSGRDINRAILYVYFSGIIAVMLYQFAAYKRARDTAFFNSEKCCNRELLELYFQTALDMGISPSKIPVLREGSTSMLAGCLHPQVICRKGVMSEESKMVFAHELNHYKNYDNPILSFSTFVCCLFWYNPLMWIVRRMLREDIELLCDARTLESCRIESTEYALMLCRNAAFGELSAEFQRAGAGMSAPGRRLKNRLKSISVQKKHNYLPRTASLLLCAAIVSVCLTNPIISQSTEYSAYIDNYSALTGISERDIHLDDNMTVSKFLNQAVILLDDSSVGIQLSQKIGGGNLEQFKRFVNASEYISSDLKKAAGKLKNDELLKLKSCAVLVECISELLTDGNTHCDMAERGISLLPKMISAAELTRVLSALSENEGEKLLSCYNRGVRGADVEFEYIYTDAMMELITERINNDWAKLKLRGFYHEINIAPGKAVAVSDYIGETLKYVGIGTKFFLCDPTITEIEEKFLRDIISTAEAGEREDVYYLKESEDDFSFSEVERLFIKSGYTVADMLNCYAYLGIASLGSDMGEIGETSGIYMLKLCDTANLSISLLGAADNSITDALYRGIESGIFDTSVDGMYFSDKISCGESLKILYRLRAFLLD